MPRNKHGAKTCHVQTCRKSSWWQHRKLYDAAAAVTAGGAGGNVGADGGGAGCCDDVQPRGPQSAGSVGKSLAVQTGSVGPVECVSH